jgi:hypothetical protein
MIKKEHEYLIPKAKVNNYDERKVYLNISEDFERAWDLVNCPEKFIMLVNCPEKFIIIEI